MANLVVAMVLCLALVLALSCATASTVSAFEVLADLSLRGFLWSVRQYPCFTSWIVLSIASTLRSTEILYVQRSHRLI